MEPGPRQAHANSSHDSYDAAMPILSLRLPDAIDAWLDRAAHEAERSKSELARDAIVEYLRRAEREGFLESIARAARKSARRGRCW